MVLVRVLVRLLLQLADLRVPIRQLRVQLIYLFALGLQLFIIFISLFCVLLYDFVVLNLKNILYLHFILGHRFLLAALRGIESRLKVLGNLLLYNFHALLHQAVLLRPLNADLKIRLLLIEIPFRVRLTLFEEQSLPIVFPIFEVRHVEYEVRDLFAPEGAVEAHGEF